MSNESAVGGRAGSQSSNSASTGKSGEQKAASRGGGYGVQTASTKNN